MVFMRQEGLVVEALLASVRASLNVAIYYIKGALLKLNRFAMYLPLNNMLQNASKKMTKESREIGYIFLIKLLLSHGEILMASVH